MPLVVNGETIDDSLVREEAKKLRPHFYDMMGGGDPIDLEMRLREWSKENVIERVLLRQAAPGGDVDAMLEALAADVPAPTAKEAADYYKAHHEDFFRPEMARVWHIHLPVDDTHDEETARAAIHNIERDLQQGLLFDSLSEELGWVPRGRMTEDLEREIFGLELFQPSRILRDTTGFHILRVTERRPAGTPPFAEARAQIEAVMLSDRQQAMLESLIDTLKSKAEIRHR
jgi:peptidyl-prolyl cis-trans isomerase C